MTSVRATGCAPITAASSALGVRPAAGLRGALGAAAFFAAGAFFAAAAFLAAVTVGVLVAAKLLRGGNLEVRGSNSKVTLPSSLFHTRKALKARRVRIETNLSSRSVLPSCR